MLDTAIRSRSGLAKRSEHGSDKSNAFPPPALLLSGLGQGVGSRVEACVPGMSITSILVERLGMRTYIGPKGGKRDEDLSSGARNPKQGLGSRV